MKLFSIFLAIANFYFYNLKLTDHLFHPRLNDLVFISCDFTVIDDDYYVYLAAASTFKKSREKIVLSLPHFFMTSRISIN
jgi:hypothetical protein